jgi:hypothetical protein
MNQCGKEIIIHAGILGMKWGHRKTESSGGSSAKTTTTGTGPTVAVSKTSKDYDVVAAIRKKKLSELSNDEIKILGNRMQLEQTFKQYEDSHKTEFQKGKDVVLGVLGNSAKQAAGAVATAYINKYMTKYLGGGIDKLVDNAEVKTGADAAKKIVERATAEAMKRTAEKNAKDAAMTNATNKLFYQTLTNKTVKEMQNDSFKVISGKIERENIIAVDKIMGNIGSQRISDYGYPSSKEINGHMVIAPKTLSRNMVWPLERSKNRLTDIDPMPTSSKHSPPGWEFIDTKVWDQPIKQTKGMLRWLDRIDEVPSNNFTPSERVRGFKVSTSAPDFTPSERVRGFKVSTSAPDFTPSERVRGFKVSTSASDFPINIWNHN